MSADAPNPWRNLLNSFLDGSMQTPQHASTLQLPTIDGWEEGRVWTRFPIAPQVVQPQGAVFGGYLAAVADEMVGLATMTVAAADVVFSTSDLRMQYFRPVFAGMLSVDARVMNQSRSTIHVDADFLSEDGKLLARASAVQFVRPAPT